MGKLYKYKMNLVPNSDPKMRRKELFYKELEHGTPFPKSVVYSDIDADFVNWSKVRMNIAFEGVELPTMTLLSGQRFSEYAQSWSYCDENKNILLNFKTITRDNNPQKGTLHGDYANIPGERMYPIFYRKTLEENGTEAYDVYKMKQPFCVDLMYEFSIFTNKYELINKFNELINDRFKAKQAYLCPNGHYMPMYLENLSDTSEYNINDRKFFSQTATIKVCAYIISENDYEIEHLPSRKLFMFDDNSVSGKPVAKVEDDELVPSENSDYYYQKTSIIMDFPAYKDVIKFTMDKNTVINQIDFTNIRNFKIYINDNQVFYEKKFEIKENDSIRIKINVMRFGEPSNITLHGYYPDEIFDKKKDDYESILDSTQSEDTIIIE